MQIDVPARLRELGDATERLISSCSELRDHASMPIDARRLVMGAVSELESSRAALSRAAKEYEVREWEPH